MVDGIEGAEGSTHLGKQGQTPHLVAQFAQRAKVILQNEGIAGLGKRIAGRLRRQPLHIRGYIVALRLDHPTHVPPPTVEVETHEVKATDQDILAALAQVDEWETPTTQLLDRLQQGHRCYVARHQGEIVAGQWFLEGEFDSLFLGRRFQLAANEVYGYNTFTVPAFRGRGINSYMTAESARSIRARSPRKTHLLFLINVTNKASLRAAAKVGFTRVGQVGFVELFGIRLHYILGRDALPATRRRFFFERM